MTKKGLLFVIIQFATILLLSLRNSDKFKFWHSGFYLLAEGLGLWAIYEVRKSRLSIFPELKLGSQLITRGPYSVIRHPMYSAILIAFITQAFFNGQFFSFLVYLILFLNLTFKMRYEEEILLNEFAAYGAYRERTNYLIPLIL